MGGGDLQPDASEAFRCLREKLTQAPILAFPQSGVPFTLVTGASLEHNYGRVLHQFQNERNHAIAYFYQGLQANKKNYSAYFLEMGAAAATIEHFCRAQSITTSREGRGVVKLPRAREEESRRYSI